WPPRRVNLPSYFSPRFLPPRPRPGARRAPRSPARCPRTPPPPRTGGGPTTRRRVGSAQGPASRRSAARSRRPRRPPPPPRAAAPTKIEDLFDDLGASDPLRVDAPLEMSTAAAVDSGDRYLDAGRYDDALADFEKRLLRQPTDRTAKIGRCLALGFRQLAGGD